MKTTVMFINNAEPLVGTPVRLAGDESRVTSTDDEGKIVLDLISGTHTFEIMIDGEWQTREVERKGDASLFIVDISRSNSTDMSTLDTLQINLASLVGDRYVFETVLGRGGMGIVVKAIDRLLNRPVAIKMLSDELQDNEEAQQIFLVEARNLATLSHPNLVAIHDILNIDGRVLMVFEYVLGENLEDQVNREGGLDEVDALRYAIQLTRCVTYLHDHELIHRDLKPANIIVQADGTLKLIDFGLARSLNELYIRGTRVRGTPAYMAPEQIQGIHLTVQTDIYQIGISLYETMAGKLPFPSGDMAYAHVHREPPSLMEVRPDLDPEFVALIHQCLEKKPGDRPNSSQELLTRLSSIYSRLVNDDGSGLGLSEVTGSFSSVSSASLDVSSVVDEVDRHFDSFEDNAQIPEFSGGPDQSQTRRYLVGGIIILISLIVIIVSLNVILGSDEQADSVAAVPPIADNVPEEIATPTRLTFEPESDSEPDPEPEPAELAEARGSEAGQVVMASTMSTAAEFAAVANAAPAPSAVGVAPRGAAATPRAPQANPATLNATETPPPIQEPAPMKAPAPVKAPAPASDGVQALPSKKTKKKKDEPTDEVKLIGVEETRSKPAGLLPVGD